MTLPSSGAISLQMLQAEYGGTSGLQSYGLAVLGRANCSLQEFYGRSAEVRYGPYLLGAPPTALNLYTLSTKYGSVDIRLEQAGGLSFYYFYSEGNPTAWSNFKRVDNQAGATLSPTSSSWISWSMQPGWMYASSVQQPPTNTYWVFK